MAIMPFVKRLHVFAGKKLYLNLFYMIIIPFLEGLGIYLLIPMLGLIGLFDTGAGSSSPVEWLTSRLSLPEQFLSLPAVLGAYVAILTGQALLQRSQSLLNIRIQQGFVRYMRIELYQSLLQAKWSYFLRKRKSDFNHILTAELARVSQGTIVFFQLAAALLFTAIQIGVAFTLSAKLTLLVLGSGAVLALFARKFIHKAKKLGDQTSRLSQDYYAGISDQLSGLKDMKSNRLERTQLGRFESLCRRMEANIVGFVTLQSMTQLYYRITAAFLIALFVYLSVGVLDVQAEQLMLIVLIFARLWPRFSGIQSNLEQIGSMFPAFRSIMEVQRECGEAMERFPLTDTGGSDFQVKEHIQFRDVGFSYGDEGGQQALSRINLTIPANRMTAVVGKSGAGKSTLIDMLLGLIEPGQGDILVDGAALTGDKMSDFRRSVGYVSQDPFLFHASIRENLQLVAPGATEEQMWEALAFSASESFVKALPEGLDTVIGDRGIRLSGGERQRIVLARAVLRKPAVLVLDEATSALDTANERLIQSALERLKGSMTVIVIAHRLSTIRGADQVVVLERGEIAELGSFEQLSGKPKSLFGSLLRQQADWHAESS